LIRVHAAALNPIDIYRLTGKHQAPGADHVIGYDYAGTIVQCHDTSGDAQPGQTVFGSVHESGGQYGRQGSLQEFIMMDESRIVPKPANLTFAEAASVVITGVTAIEAFDRVKLQKGESVLITGGSGGVGTMAIQIARHMFSAGKVMATVRTADRADMCRVLGCSDQFVTEGGVWPKNKPIPDVNIVLDCTGQGSALKELFGSRGARVVSVSTFDDPEVDSFGARVTVRSLQRLVPFLERGTINPVIACAFGFCQVYKALNYLRYSRPIGKVVINLDEDREEAIAA